MIDSNESKRENDTSRVANSLAIFDERYSRIHCFIFSRDSAVINPRLIAFSITRFLCCAQSL